MAVPEIVLVHFLFCFSKSDDLDDEENRPASHSVTAALYGSVYTVNFIDTSAESFEENLVSVSSSFVLGRRRT